MYSLGIPISQRRLGSREQGAGSRDQGSGIREDTPSLRSTWDTMEPMSLEERDFFLASVVIP